MLNTYNRKYLNNFLKIKGVLGKFLLLLGLKLDGQDEEFSIPTICSHLVWLGFILTWYYRLNLPEYQILKFQEDFHFILQPAISIFKCQMYNFFRRWHLSVLTFPSDRRRSSVGFLPLWDLKESSSLAVRLFFFVFIFI